MDMPKLPRVLAYFANGKCSNDLDRIFAFLHIVAEPERFNKAITIDYSKTVFELAQECLEYLEEGHKSAELDLIEQTKIVFTVSGVGSCTPELWKYIRERCQPGFKIWLCPFANQSGGDFHRPPSATQSRPSQSYLPTIPTKHSWKFDHNGSLRMLYSYGRHSVFRLCEAKDGSLTNNFMAHGEHYTSFGCLKTVAPSHQDSVLVTNGTSGAAILCNAARSGDYVVTLSNAQVGRDRLLDPCLVLRHECDNFDRIIGQGFKDANEKSCPGGRVCFCVCRAGLKHTPSQTSFDVYFSREDVMALAAQGLGYDGNVVFPTNASRDQYKHRQLEFLCIDVTVSGWSSFAVGKHASGRCCVPWTILNAEKRAFNTLSSRPRRRSMQRSIWYLNANTRCNDPHPIESISYSTITRSNPGQDRSQHFDAAVAVAPFDARRSPVPHRKHSTSFHRPGQPRARLQGCRIGSNSLVRSKRSTTGRRT